MTNPWEHQHWAQAYQRAISEIDRKELSRQIRAAILAIEARIVELKDSANFKLELDAMDDALTVLRELEKEKSPNE
jgi:hypothetical protein